MAIFKNGDDILQQPRSWNLQQIMQSEIAAKRNIFRQSLRRDYIESYQRDIRSKYLLRERQDLERKARLTGPASEDTCLQVLEEMVTLPGNDLCKQDVADYLVMVVGMVGARRQEEDTTLGEQTTALGSKRRRLNSAGGQARPSYSQSSGNYTQNQKISSAWTRKQKTFVLISRVLEKCFNQSPAGVKYVLDSIMYLLEFPQLMPLWQKLSLVSDPKTKNLCSEHFARKLSKSSICSLPNPCPSLTSILDPHFVIDVLTNFIVEAPNLEFANCLSLLSFLQYSLNIYNQDQSNRQDEIYPKLNKVAIIFRSILQQEPKERLCRIIENGYENLLLFVMGRACQLLADRDNHKKQGKQEPHNGSKCRLSSKLQCSSLPNPAPMNLLLTSKIALSKLLTLLFSACPNASLYLCSKLPPALHPLACLLQCIVSCVGTWSESPTLPCKYPSIIICGSHRMLLRNVLVAVAAVLKMRDVGAVGVFVGEGGFGVLGRVIGVQGCGVECCRELVGVLSSLQAYGGDFYTRLDNQSLLELTGLQADLLTLLLPDYLTPLPLAAVLQLRSTLPRLLKQTRKTLLTAYARATDPSLFQHCSDTILFNPVLSEHLSYFSSHPGNTTEQAQMGLYAGEVLGVCRGQGECLGNVDIQYVL